MAAPIIDEPFLALMCGIVLVLFFLGFRIHLFGMFGGIMGFLFFSWLVSNNVVLQDKMGVTGTAVMNFGIVTLQPGNGWIGPIMAIICLVAAVVYVRT